MGDVLSTNSGSALDQPTDAELIEERDPTVFTVLAERARGHPPAHLWGAALFGAADAIAVLVAYPSAWWIASAAMTLCAFGIWGLADGALIDDPYRVPYRGSRVAARAIRAGAVGLGVLATLGAVFGLIGASLGGLIH
jgi:hypothetical protein